MSEHGVQDDGMVNKQAKCAHIQPVYQFTVDSKQSPPLYTVTWQCPACDLSYIVHQSHDGSWPVPFRPSLDVYGHLRPSSFPVNEFDSLRRDQADALRNALEEIAALPFGECYAGPANAVECESCVKAKATARRALKFGFVEDTRRP